MILSCIALPLLFVAANASPEHSHFWRLGARPHHLGLTGVGMPSAPRYNKYDGISDQQRQKIREAKLQIEKALAPPRSGSQVEEKMDLLVRIVGVGTQTLIRCGRVVLPPTVALVKGIVKFYRAMPIDAITAQIGLVYAFAGGYYPTLFSSLQAAHLCGWDVMVASIQDLTEEAMKVIDASSEMRWDNLDTKDVFLAQTNLVLKTVDPAKINEAAAALYTTWLGVSAVLEKEYARVISLSMTLAYFFQRVARVILEPPVRLVVGKDYHKWIPVVIGWGCKGAAMNIAWRIQRVLTASSSAVVGGLLFSRSVIRMLHSRGITLFGLVEETGEKYILDEVIGFLVAGLGFWTQIEVQIKNKFSFEVPFPINLVTWPFDWLEKWIQWQITK